jgi:hypothetical protein
MRARNLARGFRPIDRRSLGAPYAWPRGVGVFSRLMARLGYIRLEDHDLELGHDGRVVRRPHETPWGPGPWAEGTVDHAQPAVRAPGGWAPTPIDWEDDAPTTPVERLTVEDDVPGLDVELSRLDVGDETKLHTRDFSLTPPYGWRDDD